MNIAFADVPVPFTNGFFSPPMHPLPDTNAYILDQSVNYCLLAVNLGSTRRILVTSNAVLYVIGNFTLSGSANVTINPGASLKLYVGGAAATLSGQGVMNKTGFATNFIYYGLPGNKQVGLSGGSTFTGLIYAPEANLILSGGTIIYGATISDRVSSSGGFKFHYDESLGGFGSNTPYVVDRWDEMTPAELGATIVTMAPPRR